MRICAFLLTISLFGGAFAMSDTIVFKNGPRNHIMDITFSDMYGGITDWDFSVNTDLVVSKINLE